MSALEVRVPSPAPGQGQGGGGSAPERKGAPCPGAPSVRFADISPLRGRDWRVETQAASSAMRAVTILSGSFTGSPRLILSTLSMPSTTLPHTVY
jgi:hypothetical protein